MSLRLQIPRQCAYAALSLANRRLSPEAGRRGEHQRAKPATYSNAPARAAHLQWRPHVAALMRPRAGTLRQARPVGVDCPLKLVHWATSPAHSLQVSAIATGEALERWVFDVHTDKSALSGGSVNKSEKEVMGEIQAIIRQITASVTFLPLLEESCSFDLLVYTDDDVEVRAASRSSGRSAVPFGRFGPPTPAQLRRHHPAPRQ